MTAANGHYVLNNMNLEHSNPQGGQFHLISEYGGKYRGPIYPNIPNLCGFSLWQTNIAVEAMTHVVSWFSSYTSTGISQRTIFTTEG